MQLVSAPLVGVPKMGVTRVGLVAKTAAPLPVSSVNAAAKLADVNDPKEVALPTEVTMPVRLALVVTVPAVKLAAVPVMFVPTRADGVPKAGVTSVGLFDSTLLPVPVEAVTPVPPLATGSVPVTCVVRLTFDNAPPSVKSPEEVTVPDREMPLTVPVPPTEVTVPTPGAGALMVWLGHVPVIVMLAPDTRAGVAVPEPPRATGKMPVVPPSIGSPVALVNVPLVGVPKMGVTRVGLVAKTAAPLPVSSVNAAAKLADVNDPKEAALPIEVTMPVRFALVVTVPAVKLAAVPVMFVPTRVEGVPRLGVTSVGLFDSTLLPVPVEVVTPVPPLVTGSAAPSVRELKCVTASITFTPLTYKCIFAPLGTVMPVPAAVFTVMLCPPDVLF